LYIDITFVQHEEEMSTEDNNNNNGISNMCANCGKEGGDVTNTCNKCKMVKYCNAACKKKHRHKHKKDCEEHVRQAAERAAELHDEKLFKQPPPPFEDCPICFLRMPSYPSGSSYQSCCGKVICSGCGFAPVYDNQGKKDDIQKCPYCRAPAPTIITVEDSHERYKRRMEVGDAHAIYNLGCCYHDGGNLLCGFLPHDMDKALELWHRAAKLDFAAAYTNIGFAYKEGRGIEVDKDKALHYYELGAMGGDTVARHNLGKLEANGGNFDRALKHLIIAASDGNEQSLKFIKQMYTCGFAKKEDYMKALQLYQTYLGEIKSSQRDEAAAARKDCHYY